MVSTCQANIAIFVIWFKIVVQKMQINIRT